MLKRVDIFASALMMALASISGYSQSQSRPVGDRLEQPDLPARSHMRSTRLIKTKPPRIFSQQVEVGSRGPFKDLSGLTPSPAQPTLLETEDAAAGGNPILFSTAQYQNILYTAIKDGGST